MKFQGQTEEVLLETGKVEWTFDRNDQFREGKQKGNWSHFWMVQGFNQWQRFKVEDKAYYGGEGFFTYLHIVYGYGLHTACKVGESRIGPQKGN